MLQISRRLALILLLFSAGINGFATDVLPQTAEPFLTIEIGHHSAQLNGIATDAQQRILVTSSADKTIRVWDLATGKLLNVLRPPVGKGLWLRVCQESAL